jgi:hypothetical protein
MRAGWGVLIVLLMLAPPFPTRAQETLPMPERERPPESPPVTPVEAPPSGNGADFRPEPPPTGERGGGIDPGGGFFNPIVGHARTFIDYRATGLPNEQVAGQPTVLGLVRQDISVGAPVWQDCANEWLLTAHLRNELFHTDAVLPNTGQPFPNDLWAIRFGTAYRHLFDNGWIAGAAVSFGSASDQPFHSINELTAGVNLFLRIPQGENNAWLFTLNYSVTGEINFPIPGVAFLWQPSDYLRVNIGLPFQVMYRPTDDLTLDFSYMLISNIRARATYHLCKPVFVYIGYDYENESYFLVDRPDVHDRFFSYDQRVTAGVRGRVLRGVLYDLSGGFVFDRFYFEGKRSTNQNFNRVDVGDAPELSVRLGFAY